MFWKLVARWISAVSIRGKLPKALDGSVLAPCCTAPASPYSSRAALDSAASAWRSSFTSAIEPSGSTTPPCEVPVCTEILLMPVGPPRAPASAAVVALHEGVQLLDGAVLHADFADLGADRDGDALGLVLPDEAR